MITDGHRTESMKRSVVKRTKGINRLWETHNVENPTAYFPAVGLLESVDDGLERECNAYCSRKGDRQQAHLQGREARQPMLEGYAHAIRSQCTPDRTSAPPLRFRGADP